MNQPFHVVIRRRAMVETRIVIHTETRAIAKKMAEKEAETSGDQFLDWQLVPNSVFGVAEIRSLETMPPAPSESKTRRIPESCW